MTVKQLIAELRKLQGHRKVILSRDAEGNGFRPLETIETGAYADGEVKLEMLTSALEKLGYTEEDVGSGESVAVLWPEH